MITITKDQARSRYTTLPPSLQDAVFSVQTTEIISSVGEQYHLPEEKVGEIASLVGWVLLGFLHIQDLAGEIATTADLTPQISKDIANSLNDKIFTVIKTDIDKAYAPVPHEEVPEEQDVPQSITSSVPAPSVVKPTILSDVGWSKMAPSMLQTKAATPAPIHPSVPLPPSMPSPKPVAATPPPPPTPAPAPMILHEDSSFKAVEKNAGFTLSRPGGGAEVTIDKGSATAPTRPAVLEFGGVKPPAPPISGFHGPSNSTPLSAIPTTNSGPRNVSQITPSVPATPQPPMPPRPSPSIPMTPQPPKPPSPPAANAPIVKDFL